MKNVFSLICGCFIFISASGFGIYNELNANLEELEGDCLDQVAMVTAQADNAGYSTSEVEFYTQVALAYYCYGYSLEEIYAAY